MEDCVFCKIADHSLKSWTVYEDELVMAFFDAAPVSQCHTLIIPKKHYENIYDIDEKSLDRIMRVAKKLALAYKKALGVRAVNLLSASGKEAQQSVAHFHLHLVPRKEDDGLDLWFKPDKKAAINADHMLMLIKEALAEEPKQKVK